MQKWIARDMVFAYLIGFAGYFLSIGITLWLVTPYKAVGQVMIPSSLIFFVLYIWDVKRHGMWPSGEIMG
jgi:uncharacterized membrane protein